MMKLKWIVSVAILLSGFSGWCSPAGKIVIAGVVQSFDRKTVTIDGPNGKTKVPRSAIFPGHLEPGTPVLISLTPKQFSQAFTKGQ
jgi:hypothetical protein